MVERIPTFPELEFEEKGHVYKLDGSIIPSVTTLMEPLSKKQYDGIDPAILDRAAARGTAVHNAIENYLEFGVEDIAPEYAGYFEAFLKWYRKNNPKVLSTEHRVYHKILRYAGTSDLLCIEDGALDVVDYKTSASVNDMLCGVQLEGYDRAFESHGVKIDRRKILHLMRDGNYSVTTFPNTPEYYSVLSALLTIRNYMNKF